MAYWTNISNHLKPIITAIGDGINTAVPPRDIKDSQSPDSINVNTYNYPAMTVRKDITQLGATHANSKSLLLTYKGEILLKIIGNKLNSWNGSQWNVNATLPVTPQDLLNATNFMDNIYIVTDGSKVIEITKTWGVTTMSNSPNKAIDIATHANRLYVVYDNILHYSGLRETNNWETVNESGKIQISTTNGEDLTAITAFANHIVVFSRNGVYELYGTGPFNYEPMTLSTDIGCVAPETIVELKQNLLWLGTDGIYNYNGGTIPKKISWAVEKYFQRINKDYEHLSCAGTDGRRYYIAIPIDNSTVPNLVIMYDLEIGEWYVQDYGPITQFIRFEDQLYYNSGTQVYLMEQEDNDNVEWYWTSKPFSDGDTSRRVNWYKLYVVVDLPVGSTLSISLSLSHEAEDWELLDVISPNVSLKRHKLIVPLGMAYDVDWVRIKLEGKGPCTVYEIQRYLRVKPW